MVDRDGFKFISITGIFLYSILLTFPETKLRMNVIYPFVFVSSECSGVKTFKMN